MDFVYYINLIFPAHGSEFNIISEFANIFDSPIARGVDFKNVARNPLSDFSTRITFVTRFVIDRILAVQSFRKNSRDRRFTDSSRTEENICVTDFSGFKCVLKSAYGKVLMNYVPKYLRAIFPRKDFVSSCHNTESEKPGFEPGVLLAHMLSKHAQ